MATTTIKALTLNCWGVFTPGACHYRHERISHISKVLAKSDYDIVLLEEIWTQADYNKICNHIQGNFQYTHYFHSGMFGTGVCIFSKHPIMETFQRQFQLNGYAHKVYHGDWFGGKGVGLAKILCKGFSINVYGTHLHAQYDEATDEYLAHRVSQSYEIGQFIKMTSQSCDAVLAGGDFNLQPKDLGYKLITSNAALKDAWVHQPKTPEDEFDGSTCDRPDNIFHSKHTLTYAPKGLRLDFLLYKGSAGCEMKCESCNLTFQKIPGEKFPYSDHEGVEAIFTLKKHDKVEAPKRDYGEIEKHFTDAIPILDQGEKKVKADQIFYAVGIVLLIIALTFTSDLTLPFGLGFFLVIMRVLGTITVGYFGWMFLVMTNWELNGIAATRKDINFLLKANPNPM